MSKPSKTATCSGAASHLSEYLDRVRDQPFAWGAHDCLHFALKAMSAQTGKTYETPSYSDAVGAVRVSQQINIVDEMDRLFCRCPHVPPPGSLVAAKENTPIGRRLGVVVSDRAAYVSPNGLVFARLQPDTDLYWTLP